MRNFTISAAVVKMIISRRLSWADHVARMEDGRSAFKTLTGKSAGKKLLGRPRCRWEENIKWVWYYIVLYFIEGVPNALRLFQDLLCYLEFRYY